MVLPWRCLNLPHLWAETGTSSITKNVSNTKMDSNFFIRFFLSTQNVVTGEKSVLFRGLEEWLILSQRLNSPE